MKQLPKLLLTGVAFSLAILCVLFYWLAIRPQPVTRGTISLPGAPYATAGRDRLGVPHIESKSLEEVLWVQGYVTAQDRLWQMDLLRRISAGELAEVLGSSMLSLDRESRTLGFRRAVKSIVERLQAKQSVNCIEAAIASASGSTIHLQHLPRRFQGSQAPVTVLE